MVMDLKKEFVTDKDKEKDGVYYYPDLENEDSWLLIARLGNENYAKEFAKLPHNVQIKIRNGKLKFNESKKYFIPLIADTILLDWNGIAYDGEEIPYTKKNAEKYLAESDDFLKFVMDFADDRENYVPEEEADTEGNLNSFSD